jgi:hypothetical protein
LFQAIRGSRPAPNWSEADSTESCGSASKASKVIVLAFPTCFKTARVSSPWFSTPFRPAADQ